MSIKQNVFIKTKVKELFQSIVSRVETRQIYNAAQRQNVERRQLPSNVKRENGELQSIAKWCMHPNGTKMSHRMSQRSIQFSSVFSTRLISHLLRFKLFGSTTLSGNAFYGDSEISASNHVIQCMNRKKGHNLNGLKSKFVYLRSSPPQTLCAFARVRVYSPVVCSSRRTIHSKLNGHFGCWRVQVSERPSARVNIYVFPSSFRFQIKC